MINYLLAALTATILTILTTPVTIILAKKFNFIDYPTRKHPAIVHDKPIPRAGGLPILVTLLILVPLFITPLDKRFIAILASSVLVVFTGLVDDKYDLSPYLRFGLNILAALIVVGAGVGITWISNPLDTQIRFDSLIWSFEFLGRTRNIVVLADLFALGWIVWMMNAINWSKGVDGQMPGIAAISTVVLGLVALKYAQNDPTQWPVVILAMIVSGAYLGFLFFNVYPQKIMPGYGGGALAGFMLAVLSILAGGKLATTLLVLAIPLADAVFAILRRLYHKKSPFWGDRGHLHHKLLELGWSKRKIALFYWVVCAVLGIVALNLDSQTKFFAVVMLGLVILAVLLTLTYLLNKKGTILSKN
ncbi:MAG: undecaprenyl/decaprenyl-phosphate alpha-N-acetylglucosaminyl 1-phosphate transferase [Patescibacteria group bacterium]|nr:undecaprenyl/decaprenyl-phosphate alpha-N-acetylglucosaminyl 1-phosphate transferase [Patescibacteria group bacterium]